MDYDTTQCCNKEQVPISFIITCWLRFSKDNLWLARVVLPFGYKSGAHAIQILGKLASRLKGSTQPSYSKHSTRRQYSR